MEIPQGKGDVRIGQLAGILALIHQLFHLAADHQLGDLHHAGVLDLPPGHEFPVPQYGQAIRHRHHLVQPVGDKDNRDPPVCDLPHNGQQPLRFAFREHGGGLVEHQQLDAGFIDLPGDLHKLHITDGQPRHLDVFADVHADIVQGLAGVRRHPLHIQGLQVLAKDPAHDGRMADLPAHLDVFRNGKTRDEHKFLMHHADAKVHRVLGRIDDGWLAVDFHRTLKPARAMDDGHAEQDIHQGGFPRAVFAHQRVDLPCFHFQIDVFEDPVAIIFFGNIVHSEDIWSFQIPSSYIQNASLLLGRKPEGVYVATLSFGWCA